MEAFLATVTKTYLSSDKPLDINGDYVIK